jgi:L-ascorbate metabolism protein UlaG (beta-lactamase superfamily)
MPYSIALDPRPAPGSTIAVMKFLCCVVLLTAAATLAAAARETDAFATAAGPVRITPIHHASFLIEAGGKAIQVDPWSQGNYDGLPKAGLILVTDIHPDHLDPAEIAKLSTPETVVIAPPAVAVTITSAKVLRNGETTTWDGWTIAAIPMYNMKRGPAPGKFYHDKGRGNGYVLTYGGKRFYIAGDTEGTPEMRALKNIDVAFVPMNVPYTMTPEEAADAVRAFHPAVVYPYHYHGSDLTVFSRALEGTGIEVRIRNWY